jgi:acyl-coenzyme A thioesterase PaaI-like protein
MQKQDDTYPYCFGCGSANPKGLGLQHTTQGEYVVTEFTPQDEHQGWPGIVHGGVMETLLYEVLENHPFLRGDVAMMRTMSTSFRRPARIGDRIVARSWLKARNGKEIEVAAELKAEGGTVLTEGSATMVVLSDAQKSRLGIA